MITARKTRTLLINEVPDDIRQLIKDKRRIGESWQETIIRLLRQGYDL